MLKIRTLAVSFYRTALFLVATAVVSMLTLTSCDKTEDEAQSTYDKLQGTWVSTHAEGHEYLIDTQTGEYLWKEEFDHAVESTTDSYYMKFRLDRNNKVTILEIGDPQGMTVPSTYSYSFNGHQIGGVVFSGDYTNYMTIIEITDSKLVLELDDKGTDEDGYNDFYGLYTFQKVNQ